MAAYEYKSPHENELDPIASAREWPCRESYSLTWYLRFIPGYLLAWLNHLIAWIDEKLHRIGFRFNLLKAYKRLFWRGRLGFPLPDFALDADDDEAFGYRRVGGSNPLSLMRAADLQSLRDRIPLDIETVEKRLSSDPRYRFGGSLAAAASAGNLFFVDFTDLNGAIPHRIKQPGGWRRDSRWRAKYFATPIAVFIELPVNRAHQRVGANVQSAPDYRLVPIAILIEPGWRVAYPPSDPGPDQGWEWRIAKFYFETADASFHESIGHAYRSHLILEPFAMATPRRLPKDHPVRMLLEPHLRFTLQANRDAYNYVTDRSKTYARFYSGTLECQRSLMKFGHLQRVLGQIDVEADLMIRDVASAPHDYPYRADARLWRPVLQKFAESYVAAFYASDSEIVNDSPLQEWLHEIQHPGPGGLHVVVPGGILDRCGKLVDLLAQLLFIAGPGHAAQHYSSTYFSRYSPAFPAGAWAPPPERQPNHNGLFDHRASYEAALPPIGAARLQFTYSTFLDFRYDRFGDYRAYALGHCTVPAVKAAIATLKSDLKSIEAAIQAAQPGRRYRYDFLLPSKVPNSVNI